MTTKTATIQVAVGMLAVWAGLGACDRASGIRQSPQNIGNRDDAGLCPGAPSQPGSHPEVTACAVTDVSSYGILPDGGQVACTTDVDCQGAGLAKWCHEGQCRVDQCLNNEDCPAAMACGCASQFGGNIVHTNACVPAQCRVDADCGPGGACSPSMSGHCGSLTGYFCHTSGDTCTADADCCHDTTRPLCRYQPTLGSWACQAVIVCNG